MIRVWKESEKDVLYRLQGFDSGRRRVLPGLRQGGLDGAEKYLKITEQKGCSQKSINNIRSELHLKRRRFF